MAGFISAVVQIACCMLRAHLLGDLAGAQLGWRDSSLDRGHLR
jgi:hypothetical protein